jgi:hypothetical protein
MNWLKTMMAKVNPAWIKYVTSLLVSAIVGAVCVWLGMPNPVQPDPLPPTPIFIGPSADPYAVECAEQQAAEGKAEIFHTGWVNDPDQVQKVSATLPNPIFIATAAGASEDPLPKSAYLWQAYEQLFARPPPEMNQNPIGSCVSFGTSRAIERSMGVDIAVNKKPYTFKHIVEEGVYGISRYEIGFKKNGSSLYRGGDGSVGAWAAAGVKEYGFLPRGVNGNGKYDLTKYSPELCRKWGRDGLPDDLEPVAKLTYVQDITRLQSWEDAKRALANGYGIAICSNVGFTSQRDANGICVASGNWAHCMALDGYHTDDSGREYGHIENSWGANYHKGPVGFGNPNKAGFWTHASTIDRMIKQGDTWAFSGVKGFPKQKKVIDWFAKAEPKRIPDAFAASNVCPCKKCDCFPECDCDCGKLATSRRREVEFAMAP